MKYINSPNNSIYNKSKNLYQSANKILLQKNIILTEGCFDLIAITKAGFESIAICGSSFHLKSIRNIIFKKNIIMCLDNDNAGLLASKKILYKLLSIGITPNISILSKKDPASFMQNNNIKLLNLEINKNTDALTYFIKNINTNLINNKKQKEEIINEFSIYIKAHPRNLIKIKYCKILAFKLKEDKNLLEKKILNIESKKNIHFFCTDVEKKNQYKYFEKMLLGYFAKNYKYLKHFSEKYLNYLKVIQKNIFLKLKLIENNNKKEIFNIYKKEKILNNPLMRNILIIKNTNQFIKNSYLNIIKSIKINLKKQKKNKKINKNIYAINLAYNEGDKKLAILLQKKIKKN
jgi:DNA primase